jgi:hypothetical protein
MLRVISKIFCWAAIGASLAGCTILNGTKPESKAEVKAVYTSEPVKIDGNLNEKAWANAPSYKLAIPKKTYDRQPECIKQKVDADKLENGEYKLLWDKDYLYVGVNFSDSDLYAYGKENEMHHYGQGDVAEVFIKPENDTYYWELYVTPAGKKTSFFIPGRGCLMGPNLTTCPINTKVAAKIQGTLNKWQDKDNGWTAEMAIPRKELEQHGAKFNPDEKWNIFLARYNYSRYLPEKELSSFPRQANVPSFHIWEEYGKLKLVK